MLSLLHLLVHKRDALVCSQGLLPPAASGGKGSCALLAQFPKTLGMSYKPLANKPGSYSSPEWNQNLLNYSNPCTSQVMLLQAFSWLAFLSAAVPHHACPPGGAVVASPSASPWIQPSVGFCTTEILICPNFLHLLWSFQLLGDTHLHATAQLISCFTGCILQFFSDGSPSDILWQLISKVGHEFKKYVIWTPLAINCLHALVCLLVFKKLLPFNVNIKGGEEVCDLAILQNRMNLKIVSITSPAQAIRKYISLPQHYIL